MLTFKQYLKESDQTFDFAAFRGIIDHFGAAKIGPKYKEQYLKNIDTLERALEQKVIYNPQFAEIKSYVTLVFERVSEYLTYTHYADTLRANKEFADSGFSFQSIKKNDAHWKKFGTKYQHLVEFYKIALSMKEAMELAKSYIVKGKAPKPVDPNAKPVFNKPMASKDAQTQVVAILTEAIEAARGEYELYFTKHYRRDANLAKNAYDEQTKKFNFASKEQGKSLAPVIQNIFDNNYMKGYVLKPNYDDILVKMAKRDVDYILQEFLAKNVSKLALIFQKKEKLESHKIISNHVRHGVLENEMYFKFSDGSSFVLYSKVEYSQSKYGTRFLKTPTRFTNVTFADGTKMSMPSEERMIKEF